MLTGQQQDTPGSVHAHHACEQVASNIAACTAAALVRSALGNGVIGVTASSTHTAAAAVGGGGVVAVAAVAWCVCVMLLAGILLVLLLLSGALLASVAACLSLFPAACRSN